MKETIRFFDNREDRKWVVPIVIGIIFFLTGSMGLFDMLPKGLNLILTLLGLCMYGTFMLRFLYPKNMIHWNKKGFTIRKGRFTTGISAPFKDIQDYSISNHELSISTSKHGVQELSLENIENSDILKLKDLLSNHITIIDPQEVPYWER